MLCGNITPLPLLSTPVASNADLPNKDLLVHEAREGALAQARTWRVHAPLYARPRLNVWDYLRPAALISGRLTAAAAIANMRHQDSAWVCSGLARHILSLDAQRLLRRGQLLFWHANAPHQDILPRQDPVQIPNLEDQKCISRCLWRPSMRQQASPHSAEGRRTLQSKH